MASNLAIGPELLETALQVGGLKSKKETVDQSLREFIQRRKSADILSLFGAVAYDEGSDYKAARQRGR